MNWFKHDTDCTQDAKVKKLLIRYGAVGYAIYFHCLELIAAETSETNLTFELEHDSEIIADNLKIKGTAEQSGMAVVEEIMRYIVELGLFQESEGHIFCFKLLKRLDLSMTSNMKFRELITKSKENHDDVMIVSCKPSSLQAFKPKEQANKQGFVSVLDPIPVQNDQGSKIGEIIKAWNDLGLKPVYRLNNLTMFAQEREDITRIMTAYSNDLIIEAMRNYNEILASDKHEVRAKYQGMPGFVKSGVAKFITESDPWTLFKRPLTFDEMQDKQNRKNMIKAGMIVEEKP